MDKVFIVVRQFQYEGDVVRVFAKYDDAVKYADELSEADKGKYYTFDVYEREIY